MLGRRDRDPLAEQRRRRARESNLPPSADISVLSGQAEPYRSPELEAAVEKLYDKVQEARKDDNGGRRAGLGATAPPNLTIEPVDENGEPETDPQDS